MVGQLLSDLRQAFPQLKQHRLASKVLEPLPGLLPRGTYLDLQPSLGFSLLEPGPAGCLTAQAKDAPASFSF